MLKWFVYLKMIKKHHTQYYTIIILIWDNVSQRSVINYQWSRPRGTHHVIGLHQDSCITHSSLYSHLRNRYICSWSVHLKVAFRLQSKTFCTSKVWPKWHILNAYSMWRICLGLSTSNLWGKKDNFNEWMQYTIHFNAAWNQQNELTIHCEIENPYSLKLWDELTLILLLWSTFHHTCCLLLWWSMLFICSKSRWRSKMIRL